ncbi:MAG: endopeptidase La [Longimicrobiales bacterium]|nr:endopeptidase La [Longimicrobiales bacterium]
MGDRIRLPVLPLRETVVFPGVAVPISAGRPGTVEAIQEALDGDRQMFAVCQRENVDEATPDVLYEMGVVVRIAQAHRVRGGLQLLIQGEDRARALEISETGERALEAVVSIVEEQPVWNEDDPAYKALDRELRDRSVELGRLRGIPDEALEQLVEGIEEPGRFADMVAFYLEQNATEKQELLEMLPVESRMRQVLLYVERDLVRLEAQQEIQQKVQEELGQKQREMVLREQMKAIQKELGEEDAENEVEELREKIEALDLPEAAHEEAERELNRLRRTHPQSAEYQVIRTFLDWVIELPWNSRTPDEIDMERSESILEEDHYGLEDVKDRILEFLAVRKLQMERAEEEAAAVEAESVGEPEAAIDEPAPPTDRVLAGATLQSEGFDLVSESGTEPEMEPEQEPEDEAEEGPSPSSRREGDPARARAVGKGPILLFVGPPGVGKTSIAKSIARSLDREYVRISLGGARDEADIRGHRRTYVGAMPGRIIQGLKQAGTKNPVFLLDEVDKLGTSMQGDPSAALLEVLDPAQNDSFTDHYLGMPFDLSEVLFIATANYRDRIPAPLLDRMETVEFSGYTEQEKLEIAKRYLLPRQLEENGLKEEQIEFEDDAIHRVISEYTREAGVRQLERELGKLARKAARKIAAGTDDRIAIAEDGVQPLLGRPRVHPEQKAKEDTIGVATGMYYTPMGGDIMFVEGSVFDGKDNLILTGQLGDVMKESARAALTYAKTHNTQLGIPEDRLTDLELHIHVPAGAVPKDGPSAGVAMATAVVSVLSNRPVRNDVAMSGEITLTGRVLPIGGVKEKVLGAYRAGIREVILPKENEADLDDLPEEARSAIEFHLAEQLGEVLAHALRGAVLEEGGNLTFPETVLLAEAEKGSGTQADMH